MEAEIEGSSSPVKDNSVNDIFGEQISKQKSMQEKGLS
jgi:hypothetical protein